ncbi:hypothetical protein WMW72_12510 [Paenibacillus filicis]|uniref:Uncharacterized protein n=1 Tax=Paenibacillus filicis TaxID=669464 RepID=A0ABU9DLT9_9BACL
MVKTILVVVLLAVIAAAVELPAQIRQAWTRDVVVYAVLLIVGSILSTYALLGIQFPSLMRVPELMFKPISEWFQRL